MPVQNYRPIDDPTAGGIYTTNPIITKNGTLKVEPVVSNLIRDLGTGNLPTQFIPNVRLPGQPEAAAYVQEQFKALTQIAPAPIVFQQAVGQVNKTVSTVAAGIVQVVATFRKRVLGY